METVFVSPLCLAGPHVALLIKRAMSNPALESTLTCPACGHVQVETMPTDACQYFYECPGCRTILRPKPGDCCVYCSYGSVKCPPKQAGGDCCR
jgi:hypothetical protein